MAVPYVRSNEINNRKEKTPPPPINQYIRCDPVRLIAPKVKAKVIAVKESVGSPVTDSGDIKTKSDDDEDNDDEDDDEEDDNDDSNDDEDENDREEMLGIYSLEEALQKADSMGLDLVLINDKADPPVCKIIDYGKFKYSVEKKKKANAKKQIKGEIKELKLSYKIDTHDFDVKVRAALKFISNGDRVKAVVQFKGREMQHKELGTQILMKLYQPLIDIAIMESPPKLEGRSMLMLLGPKKTT